MRASAALLFPFLLASATTLVGCPGETPRDGGSDEGTIDAVAADALIEDTAEASVDAGPPPVVTTDRGPVRGQPVAGGGGVFLGIPFAAPPTGALRWKAPEPHAPWTDAIDATHLPPACPQGPDPITMTPVAYNEDCLHLNVWTPAVTPATRAPVMVFIHGGGFVQGSSNLALYDGAALSRTGTVVVTINYRLGALGFLAHPALTAEDTAHHSSGNYGLLDQQRALQWVRDNIGNFGGDPNRVTIFGESAGAVSVCLQTLSPPANGLFQQVIAESGTCYLAETPLHDPTTPTVEDSAEERGDRFARALGCASGDIPACLRGKTAMELVAAGGTEIDLTMASVGLVPNIDGYVIPAAPAVMLAMGRQVDVPYLEGTNADEGTLFTLRTMIDTDAQYQAMVRSASPRFATDLLNIYPSSAFMTPHAAFDHLLGDLLFGYPAQAHVRAISPRSARTYLYRFTQVIALGRTLRIGAFHASELPFVFGNYNAGLAISTADERALSAAMMGYWTRFAATGDPNGGGAPMWPAYTTAGDAHMVLTAPAPMSATNLDRAHFDALAAAIR